MVGSPAPPPAPSPPATPPPPPLRPIDEQAEVPARDHDADTRDQEDEHAMPCLSLVTSVAAASAAAVSSPSSPSSVSVSSRVATPLEEASVTAGRTGRISAAPNDSGSEAAGSGSRSSASTQVARRRRTSRPHAPASYLQLVDEDAAIRAVLAASRRQREEELAHRKERNVSSSSPQPDGSAASTAASASSAAAADSAAATSSPLPASTSPRVRTIALKTCPLCHGRCALARKLCPTPGCLHQFVKSAGTPTRKPHAAPQQQAAQAHSGTNRNESAAQREVDVSTASRPAMPVLKLDAAALPLTAAHSSARPSTAATVPPQPPASIQNIADLPPLVAVSAPPAVVDASSSPPLLSRSTGSPASDAPSEPAATAAAASPDSAATAATAASNPPSSRAGRPADKRRRRRAESPPGGPPRRPMGRPVGWRKSNTPEQNAAIIAAAVEARRAFDIEHGRPPPASPVKKPPSRGPAGRKAAAVADPAAAAAAAAEIATLTGQIENAWLTLEYNMMHRPLPSSPHDDSSDAVDPHAAASSATSQVFADSSKSIYMDATERKELLEHVELLKERRKHDGGKGSGKCSRVGPRYQCSVSSVLPPPITPEILKAIRDEPYDYARFTRDEHPVHMGDYDLQQQLEKASTGFPNYPLDEPHRTRIQGFITRRRERKRKEEERRAQQSVQQQIQEVRAGFSFQAIDAGRKPHGNSHAAANSGSARSRSPPVNPLDSYGSVTTKDFSDADGIESKRRSSRITPSLVVKQIRGAAPAASPTPTSGSGLPSSLDEYAQRAADKRNARDQADADRKLAEKLQKFYEREQSVKAPRKPKKEHLAVAKETAARQAAAAAAAAAATSNNMPSLPVAGFFYPPPFPPSSLASLSSPITPFVPAPILAQAAVDVSKRKRAASPATTSGEAAERKQQQHTKPRKEHCQQERHTASRRGTGDARAADSPVQSLRASPPSPPALVISAPSASEVARATGQSASATPIDRAHQKNVSDVVSGSAAASPRYPQPALAAFSSAHLLMAQLLAGVLPMNNQTAVTGAPLLALPALPPLPDMPSRDDAKPAAHKNNNSSAVTIPIRAPLADTKTEQVKSSPSPSSPSSSSPPPARAARPAKSASADGKKRSLSSAAAASTPAKKARRSASPAPTSARAKANGREPNNSAKKAAKKRK